MVKAGGIITLISGIFGVVAALITLMIGGASTALEVDGSETVTQLGFIGLLGAFALIVMGALAISAKTRKLGYAIIGVSLVSMVYGGTFVAICMVLSLVGGLLVILGIKKKSNNESKKDKNKTAIQKETLTFKEKYLNLKTLAIGFFGGLVVIFLVSNAGKIPEKNNRITHFSSITKEEFKEKLKPIEAFKAELGFCASLRRDYPWAFIIRESQLKTTEENTIKLEERLIEKRKCAGISDEQHNQIKNEIYSELRETSKFGSIQVVLNTPMDLLLDIDPDLFSKLQKQCQELVQNTNAAVRNKNFGLSCAMNE